MSGRWVIFPLSGIVIVLLGALVFGGLGESLTYYLTPSEAVAQRAEFDDGRRFRLAGIVAPGSVSPAGDSVRFTVADAETEITVVHGGAPPQLFREGIEVVVEGAWTGETFTSDTMLIKHDEEYYPPTQPGAEGLP
ncbi:cytochrome c maturation protein CcmE [Euzebya sp.]|uniref:cytochrome c maturation protein CcmE n=1 Tax=Euzebya sp. TaxID=1971409 RepID=UPI0035162848